MPRTRDMAGRPDVQGTRERGRSRARQGYRPAGEADDRPVYSPPLSPEELADIEALASGADKLRPVTMSELDRIFTRA